jgi:hypothetical protein
MVTERELIDRITSTLQSEGLRVDRDVAVGGLAADVVASSADGRRFVIEAKGGVGKTRALSDIVRHLQILRETLNIDDAFVVVDEAQNTDFARGVIGIGDLVRYVDALKTALPLEATQPPRHVPIVPASEKLQVFAAMPFAPSYDDVFLVAMAPAAEDANAVCRRVDREDFTGDVVQRIHSLIEASHAVVVDLSESLPNVLYEAGYAHALRKPTIHICSTPLDRLPFDVRNWNALPYRTGQTFHLRQSLASRLKAALGPTTPAAA